MTPVRLEPPAPRSRVKHSTTEPLRSLKKNSVLIKGVHCNCFLQVTDLLPVPSNEANMYSLALAVSSGSPVLLQGVVGSGKTSLVEHLAKITGRARPPQLMKIQLGDQMDSKVRTR